MEFQSSVADFAVDIGASVVGEVFVATTGGVAVGKKVGFLPLCNCH